jgi:SAM-dependent methyltransferase
VPVTENWQKALSLACGEYVLMLGDDDALTPHFSDVVLPQIALHTPDVAYLAAYHYCYPGVMPGGPKGYMASVKCEFLREAKEPFLLESSYARELAEAVLDFRHRFNFNGQHFLLKRAFAEEFNRIGGLYQSPYPDFFAAVCVFYLAESILVLPRESVIIGISPKSFGAYYFSNRQKAGYQFLDNENLVPDIREFAAKSAAPGDMNNTNWLIAAEMARRALKPHELQAVNVERYRAIQMVSLLRDKFWHGHAMDDAIAAMRVKLSVFELITFDFLHSNLELSVGQDKNVMIPMLQAVEQQIGQYPAGFYTMLDIGPHANIGDAFAWLKGSPATSGAGKAATMTTEGNDSMSDGGGIRHDSSEEPVGMIRGALRCGGTALRKIFPAHAERAIAILKRGPLGIVRGAGRRIKRLAQGSPSTAPAASPVATVEEHDDLRIVIKRGTETCTLSPGLFDDFDFRHGDELSVVPASLAAGLLRTPEGNVHLRAADGKGIRVPPVMEFTPYKGYLMPEHLVRLTGAGSETFEVLGRAHVANYRKYLGLERGMSFLEIASGMARDAFELIEPLGPDGKYIGIDVQRESIVWCQKNISRDHPNFQFYHFDAIHELHNPYGAKTTMDFPLPAPDRSVDRIGLQSLLTHIFEDEVVHYLSEISRVLKPDGLAYVTFLLYSDEIVAASRKNARTAYGLRFEHPYGDGCYVDNAQYPTGGVAYTDEAMQRMIKRAGLRLVRPYLKGQWSGYHAEPDDDGQDVAILTPDLAAARR